MIVLIRLCSFAENPLLALSAIGSSQNLQSFRSRRTEAVRPWYSGNGRHRSRPGQSVRRTTVANSTPHGVRKPLHDCAVKHESSPAAALRNQQLPQTRITHVGGGNTVQQYDPKGNLPDHVRSAIIPVNRTRQVNRLQINRQLFTTAASLNRSMIQPSQADCEHESNPDRQIRRHADAHCESAAQGNHKGKYEKNMLRTGRHAATSLARGLV